MLVGGRNPSPTITLSVQRRPIVVAPGWKSVAIASWQG
jgi:hypothetical protein